MITSWLTIFAGTFLLEDAALAGAAVLIAQNKLSFAAAFSACFAGISIGDIGLYVVGFAFRRVQVLQKIPFLNSRLRLDSPSKPAHRLGLLIVTSRVAPGTRLPTYLAAGFVSYPWKRFVILTIFSVAAWVGCALTGGNALAKMVSQSPWLVAAVLFLLLAMLQSLWPKLTRPWERKAWLQSWRQWQYFEFWPAWFFYLPIVPYYIYRSLRGGSFLLPFYANPGILNGGLIGESKWDFLKYLRPDDPATLSSILIPDGTPARTAIETVGLRFPLIVKPDVGQRGYGVRILRSAAALEVDLGERRGPIIVQTLSELPREAGIFYYRKPSQATGQIFSITDKIFPKLTGNGKTKLGDLILQDPRARIIASTYFARHHARLDEILRDGEDIVLAECGNHCQGAIFTDGSRLNTEALQARMDSIAKMIPDFHFGRFDVRYLSEEKLRQGLEFKIVEINGAGSEATHIWDRKTKIVDAYAVLLEQWTLLFAIGAEVKKQRRPRNQVRVGAFLKEAFRVIRRADRMSISS